MDERRDVDIICMLEDAISELGGAYVVGTGNSGKPKLLYQVNNYISGKKTDKSLRVLSEEQLKLIMENERAMKLFNRALAVYKKREKIVNQFDAKIYACRAHNVSVNSKKERSNYQVSLYSRINELNNTHFEHMIMQNHSTMDEYYSIIENYISSIENVYIGEIQAMNDGFDIKHGNVEILESDEIGKFLGTEESYRIRMDNKKSRVFSGIYKEYGDFIDKMDKSTISIQGKEVIPSKILEYKLQYLIAKTKIMDVINNGMKRIEVPSKEEKKQAVVTKIVRDRSRGAKKGISIDSKMRNEVSIRKVTDEIEKIIGDYKETIKDLKAKNKSEAKDAKKLQKKGHALQEGTNINSKVILDNEQNNDFKKHLKVVLEDKIDDESVIRKFVSDSLNIPSKFVASPVIMDALTGFVENYTKNIDISKENQRAELKSLKSNLFVAYTDDEVAFNYEPKESNERKMKIIVRNDNSQIFVIDSAEEHITIDEGISKFPVIKVCSNTRIYDEETNIEMSRLVRKVLLDSNRNEIQELENNVYKRNTEQLNWVVRENDNVRRDISITPEDIATLDGAVRPSYMLCESSRKTTVRALANKRIRENTSQVDELSIYKQVEAEIAKDTLERKIRESKYCKGFFKYPKYSYLDQASEFIRS